MAGIFYGDLIPLEGRVAVIHVAETSFVIEGPSFAFGPSCCTINMSISPVKAVRDQAALLKGLQDAAAEYPKPDGVSFTYGTAGFRTL